MSFPRSLLLAVATVLASGGPPATTQAHEFEEAHAAAVVELIGGLEELAGWCTRKKLFAARAGLWRSVLEFDDDHEQARRGLGFKRNRDQEWVAPRKPRVPRDFDKRALVELPGRKHEVVSVFRDRVLALLAEHETALEIERARAVRDQLLVLDPDDEVVRTGRGEVRRGDRWVLGETSRAAERRVGFSPLARKLLDGAPAPVTVTPNAREGAFDLEWTACLSAGGVRVLGTCGREELERILRVLLAQRSFVNEVMGLEADFPASFTAYALTDDDQGRRFVAAHPDADERIRRFMEKLVAAAVPGSHDVVSWCDEPAKRLDGLARLGLQHLFGDAFELDGDQGWAFEGFGLYITRELVGTRLTWFVKPSDYLLPEEDAALRSRLLQSGSDWYAEAARILAGERSPKLIYALGRSVNTLTTEDMLLSYVLAAYLVEARPEEASAILRRIGTGEASQLVVEEVLGLDLAELGRRLRRWLEERIAEERSAEERSSGDG
ncbi:MAG: hypothetical protein CMJ84_18505 [Planctomycetes bacterium]|nr:hypothetical protein [Planctomycetota bacterium]MDP6409550.1 hypothetical protein [Planctomycetota bacterium]